MEAPMPASTEMGIPSAEALGYADALRARQHESERWEPSRLIVCNWWMFTYQEFLLVDGHLVLNGLNGSGKSSVAATAVPVALDMLKHRRRFDPFGADERDPKDYLIGKWEASENSDEWHDDRTGYVIWEFRHRRTGDRVTCGVGFRARRSLGKDGEVDHWGFVIPGAEHGKNFSIFQPAGEPLGRAALAARLGAAHVFHAPKDYQRAVNSALYGFERPDRLKELMDVLVELRKPKLQKGITPEHLSESLSAALPPLPNAVTEQLSELVASINAALEAVQRTRDHVARVGRLDKAQGEYEFVNAQVHAVDVIEANTALAAARVDLATAERERIELSVNRDKVAAQVQLRETDRKEAKAAIAVIVRKDAYQQIGAFQKAEQDVLSGEQEHRRAQAVTDSTRKQIEEVEGARTRLARELRQDLGELEALLDELVEAVTPTRWSEVTPHLDAARSALAGVTLQTPDGDPALVADRLALSDLRANWVLREQALVGVVESLDRLDGFKKAFERAEQLLAAVKANLEAALASAREARNANDDALESLPEALRAWSDGAFAGDDPSDVHAKVSAEIAVLAATIATADTNGPDGAPRPGVELIHPIVQVVETAADGARDAMRVHVEQRTALGGERGRAEAERQAVADAPFVPPPVRLGQDELRRILETMGAPVVPLYMALDLAPALDTARGAHIEQMLADAGVIDALLITSETRDRLLAAIQAGSVAPTAADRWIVGDVAVRNAVIGQPAASAVENLLVPASDQLPPEVLSSVALRATEIVSSTEGSWRLGALEGWTGAATSAGAPRYLGAENRIRERNARLAVLDAMIERLKHDIEREEASIERLERQMKALQKAGRDVPALSAVRLYDETRQARRLSERNADRLTTDFKSQDIATQAARREVADAEQIVEGALKPVPECRGLTAEHVRGVIRDTKALFKDLQRFEFDVGRLERHREKDEDLAKRLAARRADHADAEDHERRALTELAGRRAALEQIRRVIESPEVRQLQEDLQREERREIEAQAELDRLLPQLGGLKNAVEGAERHEAECTERAMKRQATLEQQTVILRTALVRYPQADLLQAEEVFEGAGEDGGAVGAARDLLRRRRAVSDMRRNVTSDRDAAFRALTTVFSEEKNPLAVFRPEFSDVDQQIRLVEQRESRLVNANELHRALAQILAEQEQVATTQENELYEKYFLGDVSVRVRERITEAQTLVKEIGATLQRMRLSNGAHFTLTWQAKSGGVAGPEYKRLVNLVRMDPDAMTAHTRKEMIDLFRGRVERARAEVAKKGTGSLADQLQKELDYRAWFEFKLTFVKIDGTAMALEKNALSKLSGGERTLAQVLPLLSAVHTYSESARPDAPKLVYFDEAFAGVDVENTEGALRILCELDFSWIFTSDKFWGTSRHITAASTYTLTPVRQAVLAMLHIWDGSRKLTERDLARIVAKRGPFPVALPVDARGAVDDIAAAIRAGRNGSNSAATSNDGSR